MLQLQPKLENLSEQGVDFYLIAGGQEGELKTFFDRHPVAANLIWDRDLNIFRAYDVLAVPVTVFVDGGGLIVETKLGWGKNSLAEFEQIVAELGSK